MVIIKSDNCDYWILHAPQGDRTSKLVAGMKMSKKPSNKNAKKYSKQLGMECVWTPWYRFFNTKREAMEFFK